MQEKRCSRCGDVKPIDDFHRNSHCIDGRLSICKLCRNSFDITDPAILDDPSHLTTKTFWQAWRTITLVPVRKYLSRDVISPMERQIVDAILHESEADLMEFSANINRKIKNRLKQWRESVNNVSEAQLRRKVRQAHTLLEIPIPRKRDPAPIADIRKAYKTKAKATHPDLVEGREDDFEKYTEAYNTLMDYYEVNNGNS